MAKNEPTDTGTVAATEGGNGHEDSVTIPGVLPLLPVRDVVVFPFMMMPLYVGREGSVAAVNEALAGNRILMLVTQRDSSVDDPGGDDLYEIGTVAMVVRMLKLPDDRIKVLVQGLTKARVLRYERHERYASVEIEPLAEGEYHPVEGGLADEALIRSVRQRLQEASELGRQIAPDVMVIAENLDDPGRLADLVSANLGLKVPEAQEVLELIDPLARLKKVAEYLQREVDLLNMQARIQSTAQEEISKSQREYYLREQLKAIQGELGDVDEKSQEIAEFRQRIEKAGMPPEVKAEAEKQLDRMAKMHSESAEATTVRTFLEWMTELPWGTRTDDNLDLKKAQKVLDEDHYDLEKVKERIVEYLAVRKLKERLKGPILCLVGPPGVGKTSLGQSVARALGRTFVRISLGGVRDEAEIRGHRRTYIGALPGKIIQGLKQAGSSNPVFMMDEIDKLGSDFRGDPSSALLEVLDPAQNHAFVDHYLGVPYDLTDVMFITTANMADTIPPPLRDRMEMIRLAGYTLEEKVMIARRHIIPRQLDEHGLKRQQFKLPDDSIRAIVEQYTREAGLRNLERSIAAVCRKVATSVAMGKKRQPAIHPKDLHRYLGTRQFTAEPEQVRDTVGVATGLAWTQAGGEVMHIEATPMRGGGRLTLTGQLGDVMKESAQAALTCIRSRADDLRLPEQFPLKTDIHVHVPAGAIPKDGPSAGITMATALASALTGVAVRKDVAMTGEITLRGRVLPIGGLKEKVLAAHRAGIREVIIPAENEKDLADIPDPIRRQVKFHIARTVDQVLDWALTERVLKRRRSEAKTGAAVPAGKKPVAKKAIATVKKKGTAKKAPAPRRKPAARKK